MNAKERAIHLESAPRTFADRPAIGDYATRDEQHTTVQLMLEQAETITVADAVRVAQALLVHVVAADRFNYGEFQAAQATEKYVKKAMSALRGLAL